MMTLLLTLSFHPEQVIVYGKPSSEKYQDSLEYRQMKYICDDEMDSFLTLKVIDTDELTCGDWGFFSTPAPEAYARVTIDDRFTRYTNL